MLTGTGDTAATAHSAIELETPRLIPGLRSQLAALSDTGAGLTEGNVTANRNLATDVVAAMETDLNRAGLPDVERISALGDSVARLIGGGPGDAVQAEPERVQRSVSLMQQPLDEYEASMRAVRP